MIKYTYENRIKYKEIAPGLQESINTYTSEYNNAKYKIRISLIENWYKIINVGNRTIVATDSVTDKKYLKKKARRKLIDLGVRLERAIQYED